MHMSHHFSIRCLQRGIAPFEVRLALALGRVQRDKRVLGVKHCEALLTAVESWEKSLRQLLKSAPIEKEGATA